jgi:hypothetical protein
MNAIFIQKMENKDQIVDQHLNRILKGKAWGIIIPK